MKYLDAIAALTKLKQSSINLQQLDCSARLVIDVEFAELLKDFEKEVDILSLALQESFENDPDIMQIIFELKSVVIALRDHNVEMEAK